MRLSVSCERCRRAKVKCVHEGSPPCRRCQKGEVQGCTLSSPRSSQRNTTKSAIRDADAGKKRQPIKYSSSRLITTPRNSPLTHPGNDHNFYDKTPANPLSIVPPSTIIDACEIYRKKFPVANFLHYPSLISELSSDQSKVDPVFISSLLSMCARFMPGRGLEDAEVYAEYARSEVSRRAFEAPSLSIAQSLVILSFYEWGSGHPYKSWMYIGMAMYMIQSLLRMTDDTMEQNPQEFHSFQTQYELLVRTYWVCFSQDCELSSGARQHFALSFRSISVPLPISDHDFTFNKPPQERLMPKNMTLQNFGPNFLTIDHGLAIVARGFDIFVRILRYANVNRRTHVLSSFSSPSFSNSPVDSTWQSLKDELDEWRNIQDTTVRFPNTSVQAHVAFGYGELFTYVNLIFFMSVLFLHRDRLLSDLRRFSEIHVDNRSNTAIGSEGRTRNDDDSTLVCIFEAAKNIGVILSAVENSQAPVITPYSGFSVFVAVHVNMYGTIAPHKYPGGLKSAEDEKNKNMLYLERLTQFWPVGHQWWHAVQEADKFYGAAKRNESIDAASTSRPSHLALANTLDEYGDIRHQGSVHRVSSEKEPLQTNDSYSRTEEHQRLARRSNIPPDSLSLDGNTIIGDNESSNMLFHSLEAELMQWPFIDETWSTGIECGSLN